MFNGPEKISGKDVEQQLDQGSFDILDVRTDAEVQDGMIPGATHIPLQALSERYNELDTKKEYVCVCRSGGRSGKAAKFLQKQGFQVKNMTGGMMIWQGPVT